MSTATQGRAREHKVRNAMIEAGWEQLFRSAGSKGPADIGMVHEDHGLALVQVGTGGKVLGPAARTRLLHFARLSSSLPILATVTRGVITYWWVGPGAASTWTEWSP